MSRTDKVELRCDRCGKTTVHDKATIDAATLESLGWIEEPAIGGTGRVLLCQTCDAGYRDVAIAYLAGGADSR